MHVHANQFDPNLQLSAQYAAERAAAKKEAADVRENLFKLAASLAAEGEVADSVTAAGERQQRQGQGRQSYPQSARSQREQEEEPTQNAGESTSGGRFSAWA